MGLYLGKNKIAGNVIHEIEETDPLFSASPSANITQKDIDRWNETSFESDSYATKSEIPTKISQLANDNGYLTEIPSEYVTDSELASKGYLTEHQDLTNYATKDELHNHSNKEILDTITQENIDNWNSGTGGGSDYELPIASADTLGGIKIGDNLTIDADGTLHAQAGGSGGSGNVIGETKDSLHIGVTKNNTLTISKAWSLSKIPFDIIKTQSGDNLTFTTDGHIKIGKNISKVRVLGNLLVNSSAIGTMDMRIYVLRNGTAINSGATYISLDKLKDYRTALLELPVLEVQENDELYINITSDVACTFTIADNAYLYVEKIHDTNLISYEGTKNNMLTASLTEAVTIAETNVAQKITSFVETTKVGDKFYVENGVLKIGTGVSKIKLSYSAAVQSTTSATRVFTYILKNDTAISQESYYFSTTGQQVGNAIPPVIIDVQEGDEFTLRCYGPAGNKILGNANFKYQTHMTIEEYHDTTVIADGIGTEQNNGTYMWIHNSATISLPSGTQTKLSFDKLLDDTSDGKLIHEDGGIRIGKGVKQILVISKWNSWTYNCQKYIYVYKNGEGYESAGFQNGAWTANVVSYVNVTEGDYIEIYGYQNYGSDMSISSNDQQTGLKVIVLGETINVDVTGGSENINPTDFNTKWVNAELTEHFKLYNDSSYCRYAKIGNMVNIQFVLSPTSANNVLNSATETTAFNLPEEYRPSQNLNVLCQGSGTNIFNVGVNISGNVNIYRYRNAASYSSAPPSTTAWLPCNISYFVDSGEMLIGNGGGTVVENEVITVTNKELSVAKTGEYSNFELVEKNKIGTAFSLENNAIKIGAGVNKVLISFGAMIMYPGESGLKYIRIRKNNSMILQTQQNVAKEDRALMVHPTVLIDVQEGDLIDMGAYGTQNDYYYGDRGFITIEKVNETNVISGGSGSGSSNERNIITTTIEQYHKISATNVYEKLNLITQEVIGDKLTTADGNIVIGKGVNYIMVGWYIQFQSITSTGLKYAKLQINSQDVDKLLCSKTMEQGQRDDIVRLPSLLKVKEGDVISLLIYATSGDQITPGRTGITLEVVG